MGRVWRLTILLTMFWVTLGREAPATPSRFQAVEAIESELYSFRWHDYVVGERILVRTQGHYVMGRVQSVTSTLLSLRNLTIAYRHASYRQLAYEVSEILDLRAGDWVRSLDEPHRVRRLRYLFSNGMVYFTDSWEPEPLAGYLLEQRANHPLNLLEVWTDQVRSCGTWLKKKLPFR